MARKASSELPNALELFKPSWEAFKLNWQLFVWLYIAVFFVAAVLFGIVALLAHSHWQSTGNGISYTYTTYHRGDIAVFSLAGLIFILFAEFANVASYVLRLDGAKGRKLKWEYVYKKAKHFYWRLLVMGIVRGAIILVGIIGFVLPGIYVWKQLFLSPYFLVDKDLRVREAFSQSRMASRGRTLELLQMGAVYIAIQIVGRIPAAGWLIGMVANITYTCAGAVRYLQVSK